MAHGKRVRDYERLHREQKEEERKAAERAGEP
jgi:hypothetical protein